MSEQGSKPSLRIDWFDGTVTEDTRSVVSCPSRFAGEEIQELQSQHPQPQYKKIIGFTKLLEISYMNPTILTLELSNRNGFWNLLDTELRGDFIVLIVKILSNLYKSIEPGEKSIMRTILHEKFVKARFLTTIIDYLRGLPSIRISEKRLNYHFWDDVQGFYFEILHLCEQIFENEKNNLSFLKQISDLIETAISSAYGVIDEHTETISNDFFVKITDLQAKVLKILNKETENIHQEDSSKTITDPNYYKNLSIFPTKDDLLGKNAVKIKPNIINGAYPSVEHYLDLQFKLLREDCFGALRGGIREYVADPNKRRYENIRVHPKVRIVRTCIINNKVSHLVDIAWKERANQTLAEYRQSVYVKHLMFGALILFTSDNFETIFCATIQDCSARLIYEGYIAVTFQNPVSNKIFAQSFVMIESEVFFEPYHRALKVLQNLKDDNISMRKYIVDVQTNPAPPAYLTTDTKYCISQRNQEEMSFSVLNTSEWPTSEHFGLDDSQMEAVKHSLTSEFSVIQGPPGTGKTYIGIRITSILLSNLSLEGTPILIICYTNHALDQFLEGILHVTNNIVRIGSQSKSKILEPYILNNMRPRSKSKYGYLYATKRKELDRIYKEITELEAEIEKCEKEIICYKSIKQHLKIDGTLFELKISNEDAVLYWLFSHLDDEPESFTIEVEEWERQLFETELTDDGKMETCFSDQWALKEIESLKNSIRYLKELSDDEAETQNMTCKFQKQIEKVRQRLQYFKGHFRLPNNEEKLDINLQKDKDLYGLTPEERWKVYCATVKTIRDELMSKMNELLEKHNKCSDELEEVSTLIDGELVKTARAVGVTTTAAARRHDLMKKLLSPIVIVEEAAEVLEAHIVASLTYHCQHLILIGDHKQLRPTAAHYKLAKNFHLEISLFERMISNGVHARTLRSQRRMRPEFVQLLVPTIYDALDSHSSVQSYPNVRGMKDNLYFFSHDYMEDGEGTEDSWSHKNITEAKWCLALANYLRRMNYSSDDIILLPTYTGQAIVMKDLAKNYSLLRDVKITVVDNYQGEECRIVILSLVRSNKERKIGFLSAQNRICVALSRAKEGLYIFGNMEMLKAANEIWKSINDKLTSLNAIGNKLGLTSEDPSKCTFVDNVEDLDNYTV